MTGKTILERVRGTEKKSERERMIVKQTAQSKGERGRQIITETKKKDNVRNTIQ